MCVAPVSKRWIFSKIFIADIMPADPGRQPIDHMMVYLAAFSYYEAASATGVKVYRYTNGFLHAKTMLVDDFVSSIGTANLDNRSFRLNFEVTAIVVDKAFAAQNEAMFEHDFADARLMTSADLSDRPFWFKFAVRFARLFSPVL